MVKLHVDSFTVIGLGARTSNAQEATGDGPISKLWARMRETDVLGPIRNRADSRLVALYLDYASDKDGPFTYVLGAKVSSDKDVPAGMVVKKVESGPYAMFTARGGPPSRMVPELWKQIWSLEKPGPLHRAYKTDFEVYPEALAQDPAKAQVDIYIGLARER